MTRGDSIARYDASMDKFTVRSSARLPPLPAGPVKLEKDLLVKNTVARQPVIVAKPAADIRVPRAHAEVAARAGRFIFMALALPPYLALYTLPKLILVGVVPFLFQKGMEGIQYALQHISKAYELVMQALADTFRTVQGWISWSLKGVGESAVSIFSELRRRMTTYRQTAVRVVKRAKEAILTPVKRGISWLKALLALVARKVAAAITMLLKPLVQGHRIIKQKFWYPLHQWISSKLSLTKKRLLAAITALSPLLKPVANAINILLQPLKKLPNVFKPIVPLLYAIANTLFAPLKRLPRPQFRIPTLPKIHLKKYLATLHTKLIQLSRYLNNLLENTWHNRYAIINKLVEGLFRTLPIIPILFIVIKWLLLKLFFLLKRLAQRTIGLITPLIPPIIRLYHLAASLLNKASSATKYLLTTLYRPIAYTTNALSHFLTARTQDLTQLLSWIDLTLKLSLHLLHATAATIESKLPNKK